MLFGSRFGRVLGRVFGGFWGSKVGFWGFEKESNFELEVGSRKMVFKVKQGSRKSRLAAQLLIVDQSIIDNIDRRSLKIVDRWTLTSLNSLRSVNKHAHFVPRKLGHGGGY